MRRIAIAIHKGGAGKTSVAVHLAGAMAELGQRVLLVDCDPQGDASAVFLSRHEELPLSIADVFSSKTGKLFPIMELVQPTRWPRIHVLPTDARFNMVDRTHGFAADPGALALSDLMADLAVHFDTVLFDCYPRPNLSGFAAMVAADSVLVPCEPAGFSLRGLASLHHEIETVQHTLNPRLRIAGYLLNKCPASSKAQQAARLVLTEALGAGAVFVTAIPLSRAYANAIDKGRCPIGCHAKKGTNKTKAAELFRALAREVLSPGVRAKEVSHGNTPAAA